MNSVFITGIPTAGKSFLANKIAAKFDMTHVAIDQIRDELEKDPLYEPWVTFYWKQNEAHYYQNTGMDEQWQNLVRQSEALWPKVYTKIAQTLEAGTPAIFEGVNLLPQLMNEVGMNGVVLIGTSEEETLQRLQIEPRWGETEQLKRLEAHAFFAIEGPRYALEAKKYKYETFRDAAAAESALIKLIQQS